MYCLRAVSLLRNSASRNYVFSTSQKRFIRLEPTHASFNLEASETFEQKNERLQRPLSPHLTIYQPQLTTILSITHRTTGCMLIVYAFGFAFLCRFSSVENFVNYINSLQLSSSTVTGAKTVFLFPYMFHLLNGIRHLMWDAGFGLSIKNVYRTGYITIGLTFLVSTVVAYWFS